MAAAAAEVTPATYFLIIIFTRQSHRIMMVKLQGRDSVRVGIESLCLYEVN